MRKPGLLTRFRPVITGRRSEVYFNAISIVSYGLPLFTAKSRIKPSRFRICAIASFIFDEGTCTTVWRAIHALRMRVSISAIGSLTLTALLLDDQHQMRLVVDWRPAACFFAQGATSWT